MFGRTATRKNPDDCSGGEARLPPVVILAGGLGTRLSEETAEKPKALVEVGGKPILWHVMKQYDSYGMNEFVIALGYKKEAVIRYFCDFHHVGCDLTIRTRDGSIVTRANADSPDWTVHLVDTGPETMNGGRLKRLAPRLRRGTFMLTWCDGVSDIDLWALLQFHRAHGKLATVTAVRAPARFGHMDIADEGGVRRFHEKPARGEGWINGAFFVLEPAVFEYIDGDETSWEREPLERLARDGQLVAYRHDGFWQCMDSLRDKQILEDVWRTNKAPWKSWE